MNRRNRSHSKSKCRSQLQALRDFTAGDACFSDGAHPLSFHIGDEFTFLSRRDQFWLNVERTVWRNNPLLKQKDYPATERGIIPADYVIEMSVNEGGVCESTEEDSNTYTNTAANSQERQDVQVRQKICLVTSRKYDLYYIIINFPLG